MLRRNSEPLSMSSMMVIDVRKYSLDKVML